MVEINNVDDEFGRGNLHFPADEDVHTLEGSIIEQLLYQVFADGACRAEYECFHTHKDNGNGGESVRTHTACP